MAFHGSAKDFNKFDSSIIIKDKENLEWSNDAKWSLGGGKHGFGMVNVLRNKNKFINYNPYFIENN